MSTNDDSPADLRDQQLDARLRTEGARLHAQEASSADTEQAWQAFTSGAVSPLAPRRPDRRWLAIGSAAALVAAAVVGIVVLRTGDDTRAPAASLTTTAEPTTSVQPTAPATTGPATTGPATTGAPPTPTTEPAGTAEPATTEPATTEPATTEPATTEPATTGSTNTDPGIGILGTELPTGQGTLRSVAAVTANDVWAVTATDAAATTIFHGTDAWHEVPLPTAVSSSVGSISSIVFANASDGWLIGTSGVAATHDGGASWHAVTLPGATNGAEAGAAGNGLVHVVASTNDGFSIFTSPVGSDSFTASPYVVPFGAAPIAEFTIALQRDTGFIVYDGRGVTGAARLVNGQWQQWDAPCPSASAAAGGTSGNDQSGNMFLDATPSGHEVVAVCTDNPFVTGTGALHPVVLVSHDGGATFTATAAQPDLATSGDEIAWVLVSADGWLRLGASTADGTLLELDAPTGRQWATTHPTVGSSGSYVWVGAGRAADASTAFAIDVDPASGSWGVSQYRA